MNIVISANTIKKPKGLSPKASLAWNYINGRGWYAVETGDMGFILCSESMDADSASVFSDLDEFCAYLETVADDALAYSPVEFFKVSTKLPEDVLTPSLIDALVSQLSFTSESKKPEPPAPTAPEPKVQDYYVTFAIDGRSTFKVEAHDIESAKCEAECEFQAADYGEYLELVDSKIISVEDEHGNIVYER